METKTILISDIESEEDRKEGGAGNINLLAQSIKEFGLINAISVLRVTEVDFGAGTTKAKYKVMAGKRRLAAVISLGWESIRAEVYETDEVYSPEAIALTENVNRDEMHPIDEGTLFKQMTDQGKSIDELTIIFNRSKGSIYQRLKLGSLSPGLKQLMKENKIKLTDAAMIADLPDEKQRELEEKLKTLPTWQTPRSLFYGLSEYKIGEFFSQEQCAGCKTRTNFTDNSLFPELENASDFCFDAACYKKKTRKEILKAYELYREKIETDDDENPEYEPIINQNLPSFLFVDGIDGKYVQIGEQTHRLINKSEISLIERFDEDELQEAEIEAGHTLRYSGAVYDENGIFSRIEFVLDKEVYANKKQEKPEICKAFDIEVPEAIDSWVIKREVQNKLKADCLPVFFINPLSEEKLILFMLLYMKEYPYMQDKFLSFLQFIGSNSDEGAKERLFDTCPIPLKDSNFYKVIFHTAGSMNLSISEFVLTYLLLSFMDISSMLPVEEITKGEPSEWQCLFIENILDSSVTQMSTRIKGIAQSLYPGIEQKVEEPEGEEENP